jgi:hypothetical protein
MKHSRFGLVFVLSCGGLLACNGDPTSDIRDNGASRILADPTVLFLDKGATGNVDLQQVDAQGNQLPTNFTVTSASSLAPVVQDTTFLETTNQTNLNTKERFVVTGGDYVETSLSVTSATGDTLTIPVHVVPKTTIAASFSNDAPALGETVTITAPAGITFSPNSTVDFGEAALDPAEVVVAADGSSISFVPPPNLAGAPATITHVTSVGAPGLEFTNATATGLTTPEVVNLPGTLSTLAPAVNQPVTITFTGAASVFQADTTIVPVTIGAAEAPVLTRTATTLSFLPPPGTVGPVTVSGVVLGSLPQFELTLTSADTITVPATVPTVAGTAAAGSAPTIGTITELGEGGAIFDAADFGASADHFYKVVINTDGDYAFSLNWTTGSDIDMFICPAPGAISGSCNFAAATGNKPEATVATLTAGTYWVVAEDFGGDAGVSTVTLTVKRRA